MNETGHKQVSASVRAAVKGIFPPELHERIFDPAFSGRPVRGKLGFGLWWVRTLMTRAHVVADRDDVGVPDEPGLPRGHPGQDPLLAIY